MKMYTGVKKMEANTPLIVVSVRPMAALLLFNSSAFDLAIQVLIWRILMSKDPEAQAMPSFSKDSNLSNNWGQACPIKLA